MSSTSAPILVYNRIAQNRRNTILLLPAFVILLLPLAYSATTVVVPFFFFRTYLTRGGAAARLELPSIEANTPSMVLLALVFAACIACLGYFISTYFVLRLAGGQRVNREQEPVLWRTVENLCLGAGLPPPKVYVVESAAPNAFSTGRDPAHASLIVTRGLLQLLDERELSGVLAHELSHIGNRDTGLSSLLAALVATVRLPLDALRAFVIIAWEPDPFAFLVIASGPVLAVAVIPTLVFWSALNRQAPGVWVDVLFATYVFWSVVNRHAHEMLHILGVMALVAPVYGLFIGPAAATLLRQMILHQREFLADADAVLLTRDPEALALALAKVSAATDSSVSIATAHLYFVDPHPRTSWWFDSTFPSHPPVEARIALLARMDDGIPERSLEDASAAGAAYLSSEARVIVAPNLRALARGAKLRLGERTLLYRSADGSSAVLAYLDARALVTVVDPGEQFVRVRLGDGGAGYVPCAGLVEAEDDEQDDGGAGIHYTLESAFAFDERVVPGTKVRLTDDATPLYKKPDGWSDVALELASGTVVTFNELEGNFARVDADRATGYISRTAGAASMSPPRSHS